MGKYVFLQKPGALRRGGMWVGKYKTVFIFWGTCLWTWPALQQLAYPTPSSMATCSLWSSVLSLPLSSSSELAAYPLDKVPFRLQERERQREGGNGRNAKSPKAKSDRRWLMDLPKTYICPTLWCSITQLSCPEMSPGKSGSRHWHTSRQSVTG